MQNAENACECVREKMIHIPGKNDTGTTMGERLRYKGSFCVHRARAPRPITTVPSDFCVPFALPRNQLTTF